MVSFMLSIQGICRHCASMKQGRALKLICCQRLKFWAHNHWLWCHRGERGGGGGEEEEEGWRGTPQWKTVNVRKAKICIPLFWAFCGDSPCYRSFLAMDFSVQINFIPASEETSVWQAVEFEFFIRTSFSNGLVLRSVKIGWTWIVYKRNYTVKYSHLDWPIIACKPSEIDDLINYWLMYDVKSDWLVILSKQWSPLLYLSW